MASDNNSSDSRIDTKPLEIGMTGMALVSGLPESQPNRKETGSTISSTPPTEDDTTHTATNGSRSNATRGTATSSTSAADPPPSPSNNSDKNSVTGGGSAGGGSRSSAYGSSTRPPGMGMPSPIGKPGHNKTASNVTSTTSPLLTLTPNSSVDGNSEWTTRHPSPPGEAPAMPFLSSEHQRPGGEQGGETGSMGSYEHQQEQENDGLLGLGALRERAQSSGSGHYSTSPPVGRGHFPAHENSADPRGRRERPPLSQAYNDGASSHGGSVGERSTGSAPGLQFQQSSGSGFDSGDPRGLGAIGRPELRQSSSAHEYEHTPSIRSAGSADSFSLPPAQNGVFADPQQGPHLSQKFGSLPTLNSHMQQQRGGFIPQQQQHPHEMSKPRHSRSNSHGGQNPPSTVQLDPRVYNQQQQFAQPSGGMPHQRASIAVHPTVSSSYGEPSNMSYSSTQKRNSLPNFSSNTQGTYGHTHPSLERRDALDFQQQQGSHHGLQMTEDMRLVGNPSLVSPGHSPHQIHYGGRQTSDASMLSSSPMAMGNTMVRNHSVPMTVTRQGSLGGAAVTSVGDEDLHHPLIGENIEVPADHYSDAQFLMNAQGGGGGGLIRASGHGHSLSMGELPNHYIDAAGSHHHLPTAGAALPLPKVVYSVKFKRTQRNFVLGPRITRDLKIGTYVKVEADRGEDLGIVVGKVAADKFNFASRNQYTAGMGPSGGMGGSTAADLKRIIRLATHDEVSLLGIKREEEEELLKICRGKVRQRGLPMNVVDAEYQFDRHKLTFFFEAEGRVDFRELVRDLFSMYKTRIWMQQLDKNTSTSAQAIISPQANLQMDYGTPIIAPASEFADSIPLNGMGI